MGELLRSHMQVVLSFDIEVTDKETEISDETEQLAVYFKEYNRRLLLAILRQPENLRRFLIGWVAAHIEALPMQEGVSSWEALLLEKEEVSLPKQLWATIRQMSKEDQAIFRWWVEDKRIDFGSQITDFLKSFRVELKELEITDPLDPDKAAIQLRSRLVLPQAEQAHEGRVF
ncbi:hypothetical protein KSC_099300 [Ktedonobacter sp. SOSP1-52]|uniref:hypothetical protein n=1 Tax=Ktedonobacter sp. SOSP1-52 TaxID=2778366 RepID=UPI001916AA49|nr:hypothetical protein [Ktedonobacter sp. SOSP1-52]GHO71038.1 hypothetical protein KSC_099300 [Ktedonobacter sp. SOSP1-52]